MTKDEELNIRPCLESVKLANEIVIVDSASMDRTLHIAREYTDRILQYVWDGKNPKKGWSVHTPAFKHDWIFMIDADERATPEFMEELRGIVSFSGDQKDGYLVRYNYCFLGRIIRHGDPVRKLVVFRKSKTTFEKYAIGEVDGVKTLEVGHEHPVLSGKLGRMNSRILHRDERSLYYYFDRHNHYSSWEAYLTHTDKYVGCSLSKDPISYSLLRRSLKTIFLNTPFCKPLIYFIYGYFLRLGFLDGPAGFSYNMCKAFYAFQITLKVRELKSKDGKKLLNDRKT